MDIGKVMITMHNRMDFGLMENHQDANERRGTACRDPWRPKEDELLRNLVAQYGPKNWNALADYIEGRTGTSCRRRWLNHLDPTISNLPFTDDEEARLLVAHEAHRNNWSVIARHFPGRTEYAVKNQIHSIMARKRRDSATPVPSLTPIRANNLFGCNCNTGAADGPNGTIDEPTFHHHVGNNNFGLGIGSRDIDNSRLTKYFEVFPGNQLPQFRSDSNSRVYKTELALEKYQSPAS
ncbi:hypothetical protein QQ045_015692 [Rhodiola kirilowii]